MSQNTVRTFIHRNVERQLVREYLLERQKEQVSAVFNFKGLLREQRSLYMANK